MRVGDYAECIDKDMWDVFPKGVLFEIVEIRSTSNVKFIKLENHKGYFLPEDFRIHKEMLE